MHHFRNNSDVLSFLSNINHIYVKEKAKSRLYFAYNNLILGHALYMLLLVQSVSIVLYFED